MAAPGAETAAVEVVEEAEEPVRLVRPRSEALIAGVAAGVARYFEVDVTLVRLIWVIAIFFNGLGVFVYLAAWLLLPAEPDGEGRFGRLEEGREALIRAARELEAAWRGGGGGHRRSPTYSEAAARDRRMLGGALLVALGVWALGSEYGWWHGLAHLWPLALVVLGLILIWRDWGASS